MYVASFPTFDNRRRISLGGGVQARWRADGTELFYLAPNGDVMSVVVKTGNTLEFSPPTVLFQSPLGSPANNVPQFDVTSDGQRFLFLLRPGGAGLNPLTVLLNWQNAFGL